MRFRLDITQILKDTGVKNNVTIRVLEAGSHKVVSEHVGHNQATNTMLTGLAHYLIGDGILNQGAYMLNHFIPRYISLGTMGLINQEEDADGLPAGIGVTGGTEEKRFTGYMEQVPGYGADGYDPNQNNHRAYLGLGPVFSDRDTLDDETPKTVRCELISNTFPRAEISYRQVVPEVTAELAETLDVVFSAMISTGALEQFREPGKDYVFITECGLWTCPDWNDSESNGLLAGYRIVPPNEENWIMKSNSDVTPAQAAYNRELLKHQILKVKKNQVVQVIWKIQLGAIKQLTGYNPSGKLDLNLTNIKTKDIRYYSQSNAIPLDIQSETTICDIDFTLPESDNAIYVQTAFQAIILADILVTGSNPKIKVKYVLNDSYLTTWEAEQTVTNGSQILNLAQPLYKYDVIKNNLKVILTPVNCTLSVPVRKLSAQINAITDWSGEIRVTESGMKPIVFDENRKMNVNPCIDEIIFAGFDSPTLSGIGDTVSIINIPSRSMTVNGISGSVDFELQDE